MDLLGAEQNNKKTMSKSRKIVLISIIISTIALAFSILFLFITKNSSKDDLYLYINSNNVTISENTLLNNNGKTYISINQIAKLIGYDYRKGGYLEHDLDTNKCYLESNEQIIGFEANKKTIYKTALNSLTDYQYFELKNNILLSGENELYIALEDLNVGCNVICENSSNNVISINSLNNSSDFYAKKLEEKELDIEDSEYENKKLLSYGKIIVKDKSGKLGLIDTNYQTIIGNRYKTMNFNEYTKKIIVSNSAGEYGIIDQDGRISVELKYEDLSIINYRPILYEAKQNNKKGIIDESGNAIGNIEYDKIGITNRSDKKKIVIIKNVDEDKDAIVVNKNNKYGLLDISNGEVIIECELDDIYYENENGNIVYYIELGNGRTTLDKYIDYKNRIVVNLDNN